MFYLLSQVHSLVIVANLTSTWIVLLLRVAVNQQEVTILPAIFLHFQKNQFITKTRCSIDALLVN